MIAVKRMQHVSSGALALLVHSLLLAGLMVGVSWNLPPNVPIEVDLWTDLPTQPVPVETTQTLEPALQPLAEPPPVIKPEPAKPAVIKPEVAPVLPTQAKIDQAKIDLATIALKKAEKKQLEEKRQADEQRLAVEKKALEKQLVEKKWADEMHAAELRAEELRQLEQTRLEKEREKEQQEQRRRLLDQELARQVRAEMEAEGAQLRAAQESQKAHQRNRMLQDYSERIRSKIKGTLILPQNLKGDSEVSFLVGLLPNGEVLRVKLLKSSGQSLYDRAVERAIYKASPLPLPSDREVAAQFRDGLILKFRPSEEVFGRP